MTLAQDSSHPTGISDDTPRGNSATVRARTRKARAALQLKRDGYTWEQIAEALGFPTGRAALVACEKALESELNTTESQAFMRQMAGERLERLLRPVMAKATKPEDPEHLAAVDRARLLIHEHADIFGYAVPKNQIVVSPSASQLEQWVAAVVRAETPALEEADIFDAEVVDDDQGDG